MAGKPKMGFEKTRTVHFEWRNKRPEAFGYKFKSKAEFKWATYLELLKKSDDPLSDWMYEPKRFQAKKVRWNKWYQYTPDFRVDTKQNNGDGTFCFVHEWHEVKTSLRQKDVTRFKWFKTDYPEERIEAYPQR
jgi:hypothetical protein